ncbi:MAG: glycosyltransferase family 2 protein [Longimicrobiales bacterium]
MQSLATMDSPVRTDDPIERPLDVFGRASGWLRSVIANAVAHPGDGLDPGLADACRAVLGLQALGHIEALPHAFRSSCARAIDHHQDATTGAYHEHSSPDLLDARSAELLSLDDVRVTLLSVQALDALGRGPASTLSFAGSWAGRVATAIDVVDWADVRSAEEVSLALSLLLHRAELDCDADAPAVLHAALDVLERTQDPRAGLWGGADVPIGRRLEAAYRIIPFFQYVHRPVQRVSRVVDAVLAACPADAGVATLGGDPFAELAAVSLLASFGQSSRNADDVRRSLRSSFQHLVSMQDHDGVLRGPVDQDSNDDVCRTWLRVAALVTIGRSTFNFQLSTFDSVQSIRRPAPGYSPPAATLTEHEREVVQVWIRPLPELDQRLRARPSPPAVSVIVPCYEVGRYLHDALASVAAQTSPDIDIVVVNDGSNDEFTRLVLDHWAERGLAVIHQPNAGVAAARNRGIRASSGHYVCCLDPDDRIRPDFLEHAAAILDVQEDAGFVSGYAQLFDERDEVLAYDSCDLPSMLAHNRAVEASVFRRAAWERVGGYAGEFASSGIEDWDFWLRLLENGWRGVVIPEVVCDYRVRPVRCPIRCTPRRTGARWPASWSYGTAHCTSATWWK